jgi:glycosyltransferase involved in cell wall biosynthesis
MPDEARDDRPGLAMLANTVTPYGINLQRTIGAGIPELKLHVLISHSRADFDWKVEMPQELHLKRFGAADEHPQANPLRRPFSEWRKGGRLIRYLRENNIQAVIIHGYRYISYARVMSHCYRSGIPFFVTNDSNIRSEPRLNAFRRIGKRAIYSWWMKRAAGIFSMGELGDQFFKKYGADPQRLYRLPYWPDFDVFTCVDEVGLERFRQQFGLNGQRRYLLFSGRLVRDKRVDLLVDAFALIAEARPNWDLVIVGDGVVRKELENRVPVALRSRVIWTGFLEGRHLVSAYHATDVLVLPSEHEPWAVVVQEAMAAGQVVVASDVVGAAHELVHDHQNGRIFPTGHLEELREALLEVTVDDALVAKKNLSRSALARWRSKNDPVREVRQALMNVGVLATPVALKPTYSDQQCR